MSRTHAPTIRQEQAARLAATARDITAHLDTIDEALCGLGQTAAQKREAQLLLDESAPFEDLQGVRTAWAEWAEWLGDVAAGRR